MKEKVYNYFNELGIECVNYDHPPLLVCADHEKYGLKFDGRGCKNLFLKNHNKSKYYLISMPDDKRLELSSIASKLGEKKLSFASEEDLFNKLGVRTGAVSILNVIEKCDGLTVICDRELLAEELVGFHPNDNTSTIFFKGKYLDMILNNLDIEYKFIEL